MSDPRSDPRRDRDDTEVSWRTILNTGMFIVVIAGAFWQLAYRPVDQNFMRLDASDKEIHSQIEKDEKETRDKFDELQKYLNDRRASIDDKFSDVQKGLDERRNIFVDEKEFRATIDRLRADIDELRQTRLPRNEFKAWEDERNKIISDMQKHIYDLEHEHSQLLLQQLPKK